MSTSVIDEFFFCDREVLRKLQLDEQSTTSMKTFKTGSCLNQIYFIDDVHECKGEWDNAVAVATDSLIWSSNTFQSWKGIFMACMHQVDKALGSTHGPKNCSSHDQKQVETYFWNG